MRSIFITALLLSTGYVSACKQPATTEAPAAASQAAAKVSYVDAKAASDYLEASGDVTVLDIRTPAEFENGHISGAQMIDFKSSDFAQNISKLDRNAAYVVHCASGRRSTKSLEVFEALGFTNITHMDGGFQGWVASGLPVISAN